MGLTLSLRSGIELIFGSIESFDAKPQASQQTLRHQLPAGVCVTFVEDEMPPALSTLFGYLRFGGSC